MEVNRTATPVGGNNPAEGYMLFVSQVISNNYRAVFKDCFDWVLQIYIQQKVNWESFPNDEERGTSFLFNMLENSYDIRANSENLIVYSGTEDWINYAKYSGALVQDLIYFTFDVGSPLNDDDDDRIVYQNDTHKSKQIASPKKQNTTSITIQPQNQTTYLDHLNVQAEAIPGFTTGWDTAVPTYNFTFYSVLMFNFGLLDGALYAMPKGSFLSNCGINLKAQREDLLNMTEHIQNRDLI